MLCTRDSVHNRASLSRVYTAQVTVYVCLPKRYSPRALQWSVQGMSCRRGGGGGGWLGLFGWLAGRQARRGYAHVVMLSDLE